MNQRKDENGEAPARARDEGDQQGRASAYKVFILARGRKAAAEHFHYSGRVRPVSVVESQVLRALRANIQDWRLLCHLHLLKVDAHFLSWGASKEIGAVCTRSIPGHRDKGGNQ